MSPNDVNNSQVIEAHTVPSTGPYTVTVSHVASNVNYSVNYASGGAPLTKVATPTVAGQYSVSGGTYTFSSADASAAVDINYSYTLTFGSGWPPSSTPQVVDGEWLYVCMDASGAAFGQMSTTACGSPTYVTWNVTENFSMAFVPNATCPSPGVLSGWRGLTGTETVEMWPTARWRKALDGVMGTSADAAAAITNLAPQVSPVNTTYRNSVGNQSPNWGGDDHF